MNKERLLKLEALLIADANNPQGLKFDLKNWAYNPSKGAHRWSDFPQDAVLKVDCNTAGCGLGLAAISGIFKDEGFTYKISGDGELIVQFNSYEYFEAAREFFEIPEKAVRVLFDTPTYNHSTTGAVAELELARRIRQLVETGRITDEDGFVFYSDPKPEGDPESPEDQGPDDWPEDPNPGPDAAGTDD